MKSNSSARTTQERPRLLWVGNYRTTGGISVITRRFFSDPAVHQLFSVKIQDQSFPDQFETKLFKVLKIPRGIILIIWNMIVFRPAIVHIHTAYLNGFLRDGIMALLAKWLGAKTAITFHPGYKNLPQIYAEGERWLKWLTRKVVPRVDAVVANGKSYKDFLVSEFGHENVHVIQNPVSDEEIPNIPDNYLDRERIVFFAGLLDWRKGVYELLQAAEKVPDASFIIYGRTIQRLDQEKFYEAYHACKAKDRVHLDIGWGEGKVFEYMNKARLLALPSWGESLPLILEEAVLCGLPVIATPVGVITDYIQDGIHGCIIQPGDIDALAKAIHKILDDEKWALEISKRNKVYGRQFLRSQVHQRLFEMYDDLLADGIDHKTKL